MSNPQQSGSPEGQHPETLPPTVEGHAWTQLQATDDFQQLKHTLRRFVFPATAVFLGWYLLYILMTVYARAFMSTEVFGKVNVAYLFGLLQFVSTFLIAFVYSRYADKHFDPAADRIRHRVEEGAR